MEEKRDSMVFYRSFYEAIKELSKEQQGEIYNAIFSYGLDFTEPNLSGVSKTVWTLIKPQIDANIRRYNNGKKPKTKQEISETEAKTEQNESETEANVNVNVNANVNNNTNVKDKVGNSLMSEIEISDVPQNEIDYFNVANAFFQLFQQNAIDLDVRWVHLDKLTYKRCVTPIRLLATSDNRTRDEMLLVFDLLKKDLFWKQNIQSTEKLREKFDQLITKAQNYGKTDKRVTSEPYDLSCFDD
jgi:hypothetical protein